MQLAEAAVEDFGDHRVEACTFTANLKADLAGKLRIKVEEEIATAVGKVKATGDDERDLHRLLEEVSAPLFVSIGAMDKDDDLAAVMTQSEGIAIAAATPR